MTVFTNINNQVFTDEAKVYCVCQSPKDAKRVADALNWDNQIDNTPYFNWAINNMKNIPIQNMLHADRYDTDTQHVIHLWNDKGESFDFACPRQEFVGSRPTLFAADGLWASFKLWWLAKFARR
jgi:hypothetical protein